MRPEAMIESARKEVLGKSHGQIEEETAWKWASRAIACFEIYQATGVMAWLKDSEDYYHEAIEHAAFADKSCGVLQAVRDWMDEAIPRR